MGDSDTALVLFPCSCVWQVQMLLLFLFFLERFLLGSGNVGGLSAFIVRGFTVSLTACTRRLDWGKSWMLQWHPF